MADAAADAEQLMAYNVAQHMSIEGLQRLGALPHCQQHQRRLQEHIDLHCTLHGWHLLRRVLCS